MNHTFKPTKLEAIAEFVQDYADTLSSPIESFMEGHILNSQAYVISSSHGDDVGYFALYEEKLLTQFYLQPNVLKDSQPLFSQVLHQFGPEAAFIPTCDELFLSCALDQETAISKQAYFFQDNRAIDSDHKTYQGGEFRPANLADADAIRQISGDFFDELEDRIARNELFVLTEADVLLGAGVIEKGRILKGYSSIGMFTNEPFRQQGIGRTIILRLKQRCYEDGQIPLAGCNYHNINSKRTLESAGMTTKTRLLKVRFEPQRSSHA